MKDLLILFFLYSQFAVAQLQFSQKTDLGNIKEAYEIKGDLLIRNTGDKKVFLMRADADKGLKIYTSKKTLNPGDTCLLIISFLPENKGAFSKQIKLVASDRDTPYTIELSGYLEKLKQDDKLACYYFGRAHTSPVAAKKEALIISNPAEKRDVSNKMPDQREITPPPPEKPIERSEKVIKNESSSSALSITEYKPNNIIFLVDVSGSMKDSLKLPLMKTALHNLINEIREVDKLTFITYADTIKIITEAANANERQKLHDVVNNLKAKGMTKGKKAILFSQQVAQKNFIAGGNNQIIIATDGKFKFEKDDQKIWKERQGDKEITLSTVAFGNEKEALSNLKDIAKKGNGSFIHIEKRTDSETKLLNEIKARSRR